eukprot:scaffold1117_cov379-Prasinococcus_capsulatus_cf.AAC.14
MPAGARGSTRGCRAPDMTTSARSVSGAAGTASDRQQLGVRGLNLRHNGRVPCRMLRLRRRRRVLRDGAVLNQSGDGARVSLRVLPPGHYPALDVPRLRRPPPSTCPLA